MRDQGHCMMNPEDMNQVRIYYDFSKENQEIFEKYITNGKFTIEDLKGFETLEVVRQAAQVDDEDEWKSIDEDEFEEIMSQPNSVQNEGGKYYDLRSFALVHAKKVKGGELKLANDKVLGHKMYDMFYRQKLRTHFTEKNMAKYLEQKKQYGDEQALLKYEYDDLKSLYLKVVKEEKKEQRLQMIQEKSQGDKLKYRFVKRDLKEKMNKDTRHNRVLTRHFRVQYLQ